MFGILNEVLLLIKKIISFNVIILLGNNNFYWLLRNMAD